MSLNLDHIICWLRYGRIITVFP